MTKEWLIKEVKRSDVDYEVGMHNPRWVEFRQRIQPDDKLWFFSSPMDYWKNKCGRSGYSILRDGEIVESFVVMRN